MPVHTRSTTKRLVELGNGLYAFVSLSETGEGIHTHFEYADRYGSGSDQSNKAKSLGLLTSGPNSESFSSDYSASSTLASSLPSSSSGSFNSSANSMSDGSSAFVSRPLQRSSPQRWVRDPESGELRLMPGNQSWPSAQTASSSRSEQTIEDQIFEREYRKIMENHSYMADLTRKLIALEELDEDMNHDTLQMFTYAGRTPVEEVPQVASGSTPGRQRLGPHGTELIDHETFRPLPGKPGVYPQRWVTHQSTMLRSQPSYAFMPYALMIPFSPLPFLAFCSVRSTPLIFSMPLVGPFCVYY